MQIEREKKINKYNRQEAVDNAKECWRKYWQSFLNSFRWIVDFLSCWVIGYGYDVKRSFLFLLGLFVVAIPLAHYTWEAGGFAPNSDVILTSKEWERLDNKDLSNTAQAWTQEITAGKIGMLSTAMPGRLMLSSR